MNNIHRSNASNPGFLIRRLQQLSGSIFMSRLRAFRLTPLQYTILRVVEEHAGIDQRSVATLAALDTSTTTDVLRRLASRKLVSRTPGRSDRRTRIVRLTKGGARLLERVKPIVAAAQRELLAPLTKSRQKALLASLLDLLDAHERDTGQAASGGPWKRFR
jgi:DNA-binding MarR family transcriptional regulator